MMDVDQDGKDRLKGEAARRFGLPVDQVRYYDELSKVQREEAARQWGKIPPYSDYVYAAKRDGGLVWRRFRIARLKELSLGW